MREATPDEVAQALAYALQFSGRKRVRTADDTMAQITAERLVEHLALSGYVVMKSDPTKPHSTHDGPVAGTPGTGNRSV